MIKLKDFTPEIYYKQSRDFQFIGRLFDIVLNYSKTNVDTIYKLPISDGSDDQLLDLLAMTLGFKARHHYSSKQLRALCTVFPIVLKQKGSIEAFKTACNAIFHAEGMEQPLDYDFVVKADKTIDYTKVNLYVPQEMKDITLLNDLMSYILPAGMSCNIIRELRINVDVKTEIKFQDNVLIYQRGDKNSMGETSWTKVLYNNNKLAVVPQMLELLSAKPADWETNYTNYYEFIIQTGEYKPVAKALHAPAWPTTNNKYFAFNNNLIGANAADTSGILANGAIYAPGQN